MAGFLQELTQTRLYKPSQGKTARRLSFSFAFVLTLAGCWAFYNYFGSLPGGELVRAFVAGLVGAVVSWVLFRLTHYQPFAEFLIAVESEMMKVSWPSWKEVYAAAIVVLVVMGILTVALFSFDFIWQNLFFWTNKVFAG